MEVAAETELQYAGELLALPSAFLDPPVEAPLSSVHHLLGLSQVDFNSFDFSNLEGRELSPKWQMDTPLCTDSLSGESAPSLITEDTGVSPIPMPPAAATCPQDAEDRVCQNPQGCCISLATGVLGSMHASSSSCILQVRTSDQGGAGGRLPQLSRATDAILSMNQFALRAVRSILQCSCYGSPQVLLLVTAICSGIAAWYGHVVDIYSHHGNSAADSQGAGLPTSVGSKDEAQRPGIFIGSHRLGKEVETALIRHVLSGMLRELQLVIGDLAGHAGQSPAGAVSPDEPTSRSDPVLSGVRGRMIAFLRRQLHALTSALDHTHCGLGPMGPYGSHI
ncbi:hypothetical protein BDV10DRAFT_186133 [Aspergillus recurvatus]